MRVGGSQAVLVLALVVAGARSAPLPAGAQSVHPVRVDREAEQPEGAAVASAESHRVDPAFFTTAIVEAGSTEDETVAVPRSTVDALCGDDDGCTMRMILVVDAPADPGPSSSDSRWFAIRGSGEWRAVSGAPGGTKVVVFGDITTTPYEVVFGVIGCALRDDNGSNPLGIPFQRLEVLAAGNAPTDPYHCLLRIND